MSDETLRVLALMDDAVAEATESLQRVADALDSIRDLPATVRIAPVSAIH